MNASYVIKAIYKVVEIQVRNSDNEYSDIICISSSGEGIFAGLTERIQDTTNSLRHDTHCLACAQDTAFKLWHTDESVNDQDFRHASIA